MLPQHNPSVNAQYSPDSTKNKTPLPQPPKPVLSATISKK